MMRYSNRLAFIIYPDGYWVIADPWPDGYVIGIYHDGLWVITTHPQYRSSAIDDITWYHVRSIPALCRLMETRQERNARGKKT